MVKRESMILNRRTLVTSALYTVFALIALAAVLYYLVLGSLLTDLALAVGGEGWQIAQVAKEDQESKSKLSRAMAPDMTREQLADLAETIRKAESRSLENKQMARELIGYVKIMVVVLIVIAIGFPLAIWLLSRRRLIGLSGLSSEVAATLVLVEERQAKLANVLRDIQNEVDYLHTLSVPDLKNLIQQAEIYLQQNEKDLNKVGSTRSGRE
ncbi:MAG: hypothetical protein AB1733_11980 [Thermodesulfobacteriota bacterium]